MMNMQRVLLASHGTEGAQAAERTALGLCGHGGTLHQLVVVPSFWKGMTGDDWLNNGVTRDRYRRYLENQLDAEIKVHIDRVRNAAESKAIAYEIEVVVGKPEACLIEASRKAEYDLIVIGSPRPKGRAGLRSRMAPDPIVRNLMAPLLVVPFPDV